MRPPLLLVLCCCLMAPGAFSQTRGSGGKGGGGGHAGGGVIAGGRAGRHPAGVWAYGRRNPGRYGYGLYGYGGLYDGYGDYEPYYGSYDTSDNPAPAPNFSNGPIVYPAARASYMAQPVTPVIHEYGPLEQPAATEPESAPVLFQLAFRDSSVKTASAYWVSDGTLYFMDDEHNEQHASLTSVDRARSTQLNRERHVPFNLQ